MNMNKLAWKKGYWVGVVIIVIVVLVSTGFNQYRASHPVLPEPLSTRGLPLPATDVPIVLPPDPGEAGKLTLEGIDSDHDGVRDDLQREIVYMYPQNDEVRRVLRAMVKKGQDMITTTGDHDHFEGLIVGYSGLLDCYDYLVFGLRGIPDFTNFHSLDNNLKNTPDRKKRFTENENKAKPFVTETNQSEESCNKYSM
jgi:hypothetical protein